MDVSLWVRFTATERRETGAAHRVLIQPRSTIHARHFTSSIGRLSRALQMESYPTFHNEVGVPIVRIGCREFKCIGDKPPQDHPHIYLKMGDRYVYFWADGIHVQARLEDEAQCLLVVIGATPEGKKELVGLIDGVRESAQSWKELLLDLKRRGLSKGPELAVADGALGFWQALEEVWPKTRGQRCWMHKTANVLNKLPKSQQSKAKRALQEIWMAETKKDALAAFDAFVETWGVKYDKAVERLIKDRETLLSFYDFPAEHWKHLRTTNVIESSFATIRHRTVRSKGCLSNKTALAMIFKLAEAAEKSWRRLDGHNHLPKIILGVKFTDGIEVVRPQAQPAAA